MCTASHNPKPYTGAKLVRAGRDRPVRRSKASRTSAARSSPVLAPELEREPSGRARRSQDGRGGGSSTPSSSSSCGASSTRGRARASRRGAPLKVVLDGGNGMAGPMVGPAARAARPGADRDLLAARRVLSRPRAQPAARGEPRGDRRARARQRRRSGDRLGRRRRPLLLDRRAGRVRGRRFSHGPACASRCSRRRTRPAKRSCTTCAPHARSPTRSTPPAACHTSIASDTPSSRRACAPRAPCSEARSRAITTSASSSARTPARSRRCSCSS